MDTMFPNDLLAVSQEAMKGARQTHSDYLKTMLRVSLAIPTTNNN